MGKRGLQDTIEKGGLLDLRLLFGLRWCFGVDFQKGCPEDKKTGIYTSLTGQNILYNKTDSTYQTDTGRARVSHDTAFSISFHLPLVHQQKNQLYSRNMLSWKRSRTVHHLYLPAHNPLISTSISTPPPAKAEGGGAAPPAAA